MNTKKLLLLLILSCCLTSYAGAQSAAMPNVGKYLAGQSLTIIPLMTVVEGRASSKGKKFTATISKSGDGSWTESRYGNKAVVPCHMKFISLNPISFNNHFSYKGRVFKEYVVCNRTNASCYYSMGYFKDGKYLGSSVGKLAFHNKKIFMKLGK